MKNILAYFEEVQSLIQRLARVEIERYEEQVLSKDSGNLRIRLRFRDNSLLELSEAIHNKEGMFTWLSFVIITKRLMEGSFSVTIIHHTIQKYQLILIINILENLLLKQFVQILNKF